MSINVSEKLEPKGKVEIFVTKSKPNIRRGKPKIKKGKEIYRDYRTGQVMYDKATIDFSECIILDKQELKNIILVEGKNSAISGLAIGTMKPIFRMAIGDRGALASDPQVPKVPTEDQGGLFNEVYRDDVDTVTLDVSANKHEAKFIKTFSAADVPITSFSNQANPVINEVMLVAGDLFGGNPQPRPPVTPPDVPDTDEEPFAMRAHKSVPFEVADDISITFKYTIYIE